MIIFGIINGYTLKVQIQLETFPRATVTHKVCGKPWHSMNLGSNTSELPMNLSRCFKFTDVYTDGVHGEPEPATHFVGDYSTWKCLSSCTCVMLALEEQFYSISDAILTSRPMDIDNNVQIGHEVLLKHRCTFSYTLDVAVTKSYRGRSVT